MLCDTIHQTLCGGQRPVLTCARIHMWFGYRLALIIKSKSRVPHLPQLPYLVRPSFLLRRPPGCPGTVYECVAYPISGQNFAMWICMFPCITTNVLFELLQNVIINILLLVLTRHRESFMIIWHCNYADTIMISIHPACNWQSILIENICICDIIVYQFFICTLTELWFLIFVIIVIHVWLQFFCVFFSDHKLFLMHILHGRPCRL